MYVLFRVQNNLSPVEFVINSRMQIKLRARAEICARECDGQPAENQNHAGSQEGRDFSASGKKMFSGLQSRGPAYMSSDYFDFFHNSPH